MSILSWFLRSALLAGVWAVTGVAASAQLVMPSLRASASAGLLVDDTGVQVVTDVPQEESATLSSSGATASATAGVLDDLHVRLSVGASSTDHNLGRGSASFAQSQFDQLSFTASADPRLVRVHWAVEYAPFWTASRSLTENGGSGLLSFGFSGTGRVRVGSTFTFLQTQNFSLSFTDHFGTSVGDVTPSATSGSMDFSLLSGQSLQLGSFNLQALADASGSVNNAVFSSLTVNAWVWLEVLTPGIEVLGGNSVITGYAANPATPAVPEPSTYALLGGLGALGWTVWRRRKGAA